MQYVGDAVMAVFGALFPSDDHAGSAVEAAVACTRARTESTSRWARRGPCLRSGSASGYRPAT